LVLYRSQTKIALNNSGQELVRLYNNEGCMVDEISYEGKVASDTLLIFGSGQQIQHRRKKIL